MNLNNAGFCESLMLIFINCFSGLDDVFYRLTTVGDDEYVNADRVTELYIAQQNGDTRCKVVIVNNQQTD
jgi:hypothetical protein